MQRIKKWNVLRISTFLITFFLFCLLNISVIIPFFSSVFIKDNNSSYKISIIESISLLLFSFLLLLFSNKNRILLNKKKITIPQISMYILFTILLFFSIKILSNGIIKIFIGIKGYDLPLYDIINVNAVQFIVITLILALTPAYVEEFFFRYTLRKFFCESSTKTFILISSLTFGICHNDIRSIIGSTILGIFLSYLLIKTESFGLVFLLHFIYNFTGLIFNYIIVSFYKNVELTSIEYISYGLRDVSHFFLILFLFLLVLRIKFNKKFRT